VRVMGLDLKPARSGIAMNYDPGTGERFLSVAAAGASLRPLHDQVRILERAILTRVDRWRPDVVFIEGTFSRGSHSDYGQHAAHFAVTHLLWSKGIPWVDVQTGLVKIWATGSGSQRGATKVTKDKVVAAVIARYGQLMHIPPGDDDACDAVALMMMALTVYGRPLEPDRVIPPARFRALRSLTKGRPLPAIAPDAPTAPGWGACRCGVPGATCVHADTDIAPNSSEVPNA